MQLDFKHKITLAVSLCVCAGFVAGLHPAIAQNTSGSNAGPASSGNAIPSQPSGSTLEPVDPSVSPNPPGMTRSSSGDPWAPEGADQKNSGSAAGAAAPGSTMLGPPPVGTITSPIRQEFPGQVGPQATDTRLTEESDLRLPSTSELMPMSKNLPTIRLEAVYNAPVTLKDVVNFAVLHNLDIGVSREQMLASKWTLIGALGQYLPNSVLSYRQIFQAGTTLVGGIIPSSFATPFVTATGGFTYYGFRGGQVFFNALAQKHNFLAQKAQLGGSINDTLNNVAKQYYELMRAQAFLEIRVRAVETSRAQLVLNQQLERAGTGTYFNVLQADTQLATDEQNLLSQEVAFRTAAITLAQLMNLDLGANLISLENKVRKVRLVDPNMDINSLMRISIKYRPELKQYEELRLAARRQIQVNAAPLYPSFQFFGQYQGNGATLGPGYRVQPGSIQVVPGTLNPGTVITPPQFGQSVQVPVVGQFNPAQQVKRQMRKSYQIGFQVDWSYFNLGVPNMANVQSARHTARAALLQANQQFMAVLTQVRTSYLASLLAEREVDVTTRAVASSSEQLRLARVRLANGVGTNIDVLQAQQVWTQSLINKADAILRFNQAQVQLLHDIGVISIDTLTSGRLVKE
ncbi:MAG: TolC family protein [Candidatus Obscuribacterales bacterium]|nr:TolC family protein [Candidatus Obscuribacterales bacterium]